MNTIIHYSFVPKFYIQDDNEEWVDFSDFLQDGGKQLLQQIQSIKYSSEYKYGTFKVQIPGIVVKLINDDGFFTKPFPSTLKTIKNTTAQFGTTLKGKYSILSNRKARVSVIGIDKDVPFDETVVGTYLIHGAKTITNTTYTIKLVSLANPLKNSDSAEVVKNGDDWYKNRPISFLLRELLKVRYREANQNAIPDSYVVPDKIAIPTAAYLNNDTGDQRRSSVYGTPPEWDGSNWVQYNLVTRAMLFSYATIGSANPFADPDTLYFGSDNQLWKWDAATEIYTKIGETVGNINKIWYNSKDYCLYMATWKDDFNITYRGYQFYLYKYDGSSLTQLTTTTTHGGGYTANLGTISRKGQEDYTNDGTNDYYFRFIGQYNDGSVSHTGGENVVPPFRQYVHFNNGTVEIYKLTSLFDTATPTDLVSRTYQDSTNGFFIDNDYYYIYSDSLAPNTHVDEIEFSYTMGQEPFILFSKDYGTSGGIVYTVFDDLNQRYYFATYDVASNSVTETGPIQVSGYNVQPICGAVASDGYMYVTLLLDKDTGADDSIVYITKSVFGSSSLSTIYDSSLDSTTYYTPLKMVYANSKLYITLFDRSEERHFYAYSIVSHPTTSQNSFDALTNNLFETMPQAMVAGTSGVYFASYKTLSIHYFDFATETITTLQNGVPVTTGGDVWVQDMVVDSYTRSTEILYGITMPSPPPQYMNGNQLSGKYYLWKYDVYYTDRIEYADFSGMNVWDAISNLAMIANYDYGFDENGDFYFIPKQSSVTTVDYEFSDDYDNRNIVDLVVSVDESKVYNFVRVSPYVAEIQQPTAKYVMNPRSRSEASWNYKMDISQRDTAKKRIKMQVLTNGKLSDGDIMFRYYQYDKVINTSFSTAYTGGNYIYVPIDISDLHKGDELKLITINLTEYSTVGRDPTDDDINNSRIYITTALTGAYSIGDQIEITKIGMGWSGRGNKNLEDDPYFSQWSAGHWVNGTAVNGAVDSEDTTTFVFSSQSMKITGSGGSSTPYIKRRYTGLKASTDYTVIVAAKGYAGDSTNPSSNLNVAVYGVTTAITGWTDQTSENTEEFEFLKGTFITPSTVTDVDVYLELTNTSGIAWVGGIYFIEGIHYDVDMVAVGASNRLMPIGTTNVWVRFIEDANEGVFKEGDYIIIDCPGMKLQKQDYSTAEYVDLTSKTTYGLSSYSDVNNKFIGVNNAPDIARRIGSLSPNPKMEFKVRIPLNLDIKPINKVSERMATLSIKSTNLLPMSPDYTEKAIILSITHNLATKVTDIMAVSEAGI